MEESAARSQHGDAFNPSRCGLFATGNRNEKFGPGISIVALLRGGTIRRPSKALHSINGQDADIGTRRRPSKSSMPCRGKAFVVQSIERKEKKRNPVAPFIAADCSRKPPENCISPEEDHDLAQQLYEGVEIGAEGPMGLITYMRTDSPRISQEATEDARLVIRERFGGVSAGDALMCTRPKGGPGSAEAIRPDDGGSRS